MADEKDMVLGGEDDFEWEVSNEETRLNMEQARLAFEFLTDNNPDSAFVLENGYKRAVVKGRKQAFEIVLQGLRDLHAATFPKTEEPTQTDSPQP